VWLVDLLENVRTSARSRWLVRRNRNTSAQRRFEKIIEEIAGNSIRCRPARPAAWRVLKRKVEVVEGATSVSRGWG